MSTLGISATLGLVAGVANLFGGAIVSARAWRRAFLELFIALGSGFMLATALTEMLPESLRLAPLAAPPLILLGYLIVHYFEHMWPAHFHFGEETHADEFVKTGHAVRGPIFVSLHDEVALGGFETNLENRGHDYLRGGFLAGGEEGE